MNYDISFVSGMYKLKDSLLFDDINRSSPFLLSVIISREHLKRCVYFTTLIATIRYSKRSVVDSRKFEVNCLFE